MAKSNKNFRLSEMHTEIIKNYPASCRVDAPETLKLEELLEAFDTLINLTRAELKGYLGLNEAWYIIDICNSYLYKPTQPNQQLLLNVVDSDLYEGTAQKWQVSFKEFKSKIEALTDIQAHFYFLCANEFWSLKDEHRNGERQNDFIKKIFNI